MQRCMLKGKIHRAKVMEANIDYPGSITIDAALMEASDIVPHEQVHVWSLTSGERLDTYAIPGAFGSGVICINGAAAHRIKQGEVIIIATFAWMDEEEVERHQPRIVFVDERNRIREPASRPKVRPALVSR